MNQTSSIPTIESPSQIFNGLNAQHVIPGTSAITLDAENNFCAASYDHQFYKHTQNQQSDARTLPGNDLHNLDGNLESVLIQASPFECESNDEYC